MVAWGGGCMWITKRHENTFEGDRCVLYLDCGDDYTCTYMSKTHQIVYLNYVLFLFVLF